MKIHGSGFVISAEENLYLRQAHVTDAPAIFGLIDSQRTYLRRWLPFVDATKAISDTEQYLEFVTAPDNLQDKIYVIILQCEVIGLIGFKSMDYSNRSVEIGYWLSEHEQGKGIMRRSCEALLTYAFEGIDFNRIQLKTGTGNSKSSNIPRKLGFTLEGIQRDGELLNGVFHDLEVYSLLKREWKSERC